MIQAADHGAYRELHFYPMGKSNCHLPWLSRYEHVQLGGGDDDEWLLLRSVVVYQVKSFRVGTFLLSGSSRLLDIKGCSPSSAGRVEVGALCFLLCGGDSASGVWVVRNLLENEPTKRFLIPEVALFYLSLRFCYVVKSCLEGGGSHVGYTPEQCYPNLKWQNMRLTLQKPAQLEQEAHSCLLHRDWIMALIRSFSRKFSEPLVIVNFI